MAVTDQDKLEVPDLAQAVNAVIATFAAFVGISLTDFFDESKNRLGEDLRFWAFIALVALLLRYIVGSAVHLNRAYGARQGKEGPLLPSVPLFVKDLMFLVAFGYVAIQITHSHNFVHFIRESAWFIGLGLLWSVSDWLVFRPLFQRGHAGTASLDRLAWKWTAIDAGQLLVTGALAYCSGRGTRTAVLLALVYGIVFFIDMGVLLSRRN
jgi:hypothetical protein